MGCEEVGIESFAAYLPTGFRVCSSSEEAAAAAIARLLLAQAG
jgi:hypothetical protein